MTSNPLPPENDPVILEARAIARDHLKYCIASLAHAYQLEFAPFSKAIWSIINQFTKGK